MATVVENVQLSDVEWLVMRARGFSKTDIFAAKAWLITARSLFPRCFLIQFESYQLEKSSKNVKDAAKHLEEMLKNFPNEQRLWIEVHTILEALQTEATDQKSSFHTEIFAAFPTHIQCQMLLNVAEKISNVLERCRLLLLAMRKFPNLVVEHGLKLVELLMVEERQSGAVSPVNCYRKLLVCDTLPLVLHKIGHLSISDVELYTWLQRSVEFYISYTTQPVTQDVSQSPDLLSPTKTSAKKFPMIPGLLDRESQVTDPWGSLFKLLQLFGGHLGWEMEADIFNKSRDYQWQYLLGVYNSIKQKPSERGQKHILYVATVLFLQCLYMYVSHVDTENLSGSSLSPLHVPVVILEKFRSENGETQIQPKIKRLRQDNPHLPQIMSSTSISNSQVIIQNFITAMKCFELLHSSEDLRREFIVMCQTWRMELWSWMGVFQTDMCLYQGAFQEAVAQLQSYYMGAKGKMKTRLSLQLASSFYCLRNISKACELVLDVVASLPEHSPPSVSSEESQPGFKSLTTSGPVRHLMLMQCSESEIIPYCIQLLITCLKERISNHNNDLNLGHLIVLLQYDWPKYESIFLDVIQKIQKQGSFTYNLFFSYVFNMDMLEELAFLDTQEGGRVSLDIMPTSTRALAQQRTVTRGVNKGVKEDFRASLEKQVKTVSDPVNKVLLCFMMEERELLLQNI
ncbi:integrator complex subunit 10-like isoform X1 [Haliotis rufescens]|uniref:integrator complex subunit 10-like isoform X1 n=2 Tax=Haliotis rufescens TaxID=6454 RepID=UPI00201F15D3|nr:integrator complex subunit 10-like isoform X1 [Haliotis rufescens]